MAWIGLLIGLALAFPSLAQAATFTPTRFDDPNPGACDPNDCSLREAVIAANANGNPSETDFIELSTGTYSMAIASLNINERLRITGPSASATAINAGQVDITDPVIVASTGTQQTVEIVGVTLTGADEAGIQTGGNVDLVLIRSAVVGNTHVGNGGGIDASAGHSLTLTESTVSGNDANNGGGIFSAIGTTITNSTISGNSVDTEGGGVYTDAATTTDIVNSTIAFNVGPAGAGGGITNLGATNLRNTIVSNNSGGNCEATPDPAASQGHNIEDTDTCTLDATGDKPNADPILGPLTNNGGDTQTHALGSASPAIDAAAGCPPPSTDQRGTPRPQGPACDMGAYEIVTTRTIPTVPECSPTGAITFEMVPGETPVAFHYKVDDGPTQDVPTSDETATINLAEGKFKLEYWSETQESGQDPQADHQIDTAVIDKTAPDLSLSSDQGQSLYVITRAASVTVTAADPGAEPSGLTSDPSAVAEPVSTNSRGDQAVQWSAVDLCENTTTKTFNYTVLGPGLGERAVIEPLGEDVQVKVPDTGAARASQKGADFEPVNQPREIPIGTIVDARDGEARITSSKSTEETDIQNGEFAAGVFKVLQSRDEDRDGLTTLGLKKGNFDKCDEGKGASTAALSRRAIRRLRARARGRFRTRGRHSAATVRGTKWEMTDRCDGTLTAVQRGKVAVRDFRLQKTVLLTRGQSYLARAEPLPPKLGETVNVDVVKGKVFVKLPPHGSFARASQKGTDFVPLTSERSIPVRSILDTRKGTVALRSAQNRKGKIQSGRFADGVFQVLQSRKRRAKGLTTLRLTGGAAKFKRCGSGKRTRARAALTRRQIRRLRARARGRYRTRSRYSAATVRGTVWTVADRCDGTLTKVQRGKVAVRDFRLRKTITVTAGKTYLAKAR